MWCYVIFFFRFQLFSRGCCLFVSMETVVKRTHARTHARTLRALTGELPPTDGAAFLSGFDVGKNPEDIHRLVGYCPQFDAQFETLTGREHLMLYAAIKVRDGWGGVGVGGGGKRGVSRGSLVRLHSQSQFLHRVCCSFR